ncbi:MAG: DUF4105 domain-containing protein, partial [Bacteriovoracaceae bacterium]|nr:DUF4105 domain-containing protein [Bacteriovoracaceae bacterium]
ADLKIIFKKLSPHFATPGCPKVTTEETEKTKKKQKAKKITYGEYNPLSKNIRIHDNFIEHILKGPEAAQTFECGYGNMYTQTQATFIHEWSHYLDDINDFSDKFQFKRLAGFDRSNHWFYYLSTFGLYKGPWRSKNKLESRSVNPYEFKNLKENFSVNFENYVINPSYACHHPDYAKYFQANFGENKIQKAECSFSTQVLFNSRNPQYDLRFKVDIDPKRVAEIHYFFADEGDAIMSRWGHAMFRLIVCSPLRETVGPDCRKDVAHHVILSYRANIQDITVNSFKGLMGKYPSRLYLLPLPEVVTEYTKEELRNLISLPIKMNEAEKENFIWTTLRNYWSYEGSYKFIVNNCATEAAHLLDAGLEENNYIKTLSPKKMYKSLIKNKLIDLQLLENKSQATAQGFYFASKKTEFEQALKILDVKVEYWSTIKASERYTAVLEKIKQEPTKKTSFAAAAFVIESKLFFNLGKELEREILKAVQNNKKVEANSELKAHFDMARMNLQRPPQWTLTKQNGNGIPTQNEFDEIYELILNNQVELDKGVQEILSKWLETNFRDLMSELKNSTIYKEYYRKIILEN